MAQQKKTTTKSKAAPRRQNKKKRPIRREVGGALCALFALCIAVSYFEKEAFLVRHLSELFRGLFGYGYYLTVPSLLLAAYILVFHRGRPVRLRLFCALVMPLLVGTLAHIAGSDIEVAELTGAIPTLWKSGIALSSGGLLSGALAVGLLKLLGTVASVIVLALVLVICLLGALHLTVGAIIEAIRSHERLEYREEDYETAPRRAKAAPVPAPKSETVPKVDAARMAPIDIPLDGEKKKHSFGSVKSGFFAAKSDDVRTPDELLVPRKEEPAAAENTAEKPLAEKPLPIAEKPAEKLPESKKLAAEEIKAETEKVAGEIEQELAAEQNEYRYPPITLLEEGVASNAGAAGAELRNNSRRLAETLRSFGVDAKAGDVVRGPSVTRYEFTLDQGVKLSKITNLQDDIALALGASGVRIAPIPDKISVVGIEVPNKLVSAVHIRDVLESQDFVRHSSAVAFAVGKDIGGRNIIGNIAKLPHVLIAGTTGSGKSVCTNSLIVSLLYKSTPEEVRFIMVDPKMVELAPYNGIPHLLIPVVTDPKKAAGALQWAVYEMMKRYKMFSEHNVKDLAGYNALAGTNEEIRKLPSVVVVIDELADLMLVAAKEVEESICRVAQMGRAAGMHLVIATQRPSADVITGLMKANIPSRIAFAVASSLESRIILDNSGAEKLVGRGDMLYAPLGEGKPKRVQGCLISAEEIERVVQFVKDNGEASYSAEVMQKIEESVAEKERGGKNAPAPEAESSDEGDELLPAAIDVVIETGQASVSMLQRRLKLGYSRAARLVDQMEQRGVVGPFEGSKPRQLLITKEKWQEIQMRGGLGAMSAAAMEAREEETETEE